MSDLLIQTNINMTRKSQGIDQETAPFGQVTCEVWRRLAALMATTVRGTSDTHTVEGIVGEDALFDIVAQAFSMHTDHKSMEEIGEYIDGAVKKLQDITCKSNRGTI